MHNKKYLTYLLIFSLGCVFALVITRPGEPSLEVAQKKIDSAQVIYKYIKVRDTEDSLKVLELEYKLQGLNSKYLNELNNLRYEEKTAAIDSAGVVELESFFSSRYSEDSLPGS